MPLPHGAGAMLRTAAGAWVFATLLALPAPAIAQRWKPVPGAANVAFAIDTASIKREGKWRVFRTRTTRPRASRRWPRNSVTPAVQSIAAVPMISPSVPSEVVRVRKTRHFPSRLMLAVSIAKATFAAPGTGFQR
ncbi:MAG: hypothetical protein EOP58_08340, partial [Sphingomonadales bacterium]